MRTGLMTEIRVDETFDRVRFELPSWQPARTRRATIFGMLGISGLCIGLMFAVVGVMRWAAAQPLDPAANYFLMVMWSIGILGLVSSILRPLWSTRAGLDRPGRTRDHGDCSGRPVPSVTADRLGLGRAACGGTRGERDPLRGPRGKFCSPGRAHPGWAGLTRW